MVGHIIIIVLINRINIIGRSLTGEACPTSRRHERGILRLGTLSFFRALRATAVLRVQESWGRCKKGGDQEACIAD